jgi:hypothetical protein
MADRFRHEAEFRWAAFFTAAGLPWTFTAAGGFHLPTTDRGWLAVVTPADGPSLTEEAELTWLAQQRPVAVLVGGPSDPARVICSGFSPRTGAWYEEGAVTVYAPGEPAWGHCFCDSGYFFCECPGCGLVGIEFDGRADRLLWPPSCPRPRGGDRGHNADSPRLLRAYAVARAARYVPPPAGERFRRALLDDLAAEVGQQLVLLREAAVSYRRRRPDPQAVQWLVARGFWLCEALDGWGIFGLSLDDVGQPDNPPLGRLVRAAQHCRSLWKAGPGDTGLFRKARGRFLAAASALAAGDERAEAA